MFCCATSENLCEVEKPWADAEHIDTFSTENFPIVFLFIFQAVTVSDERLI